jgi:hypothetical protein
MIDSQNRRHLQRTRDLISDPGIGVDPYSSKAICWCLIGAYAKVSGFSVIAANRQLTGMMKFLPENLNDHSAHQEIIDKLNDLIEEAA